MVEAAKRDVKAPPGFTREEYVVNGVPTVVNVGGKGPPLVYWHGAGSWSGFDFAAPWLDRFRVIAPSHPGWGESADAPPEWNSMSDYVLHYAELFDMMKLAQVNLLGISMGGWMATEFAVTYPERLRRLVLVAPAGLPSPEYPMPTGMHEWSLEELYGYLLQDVNSVKRHLPTTPEEHAAHAAVLGREFQSTGRVFANGPHSLKLERWLHRVKMPTLLVWSKADRLVPAGRHEKWMRVLPSVQLKLVERGGHLTLDESAEAREAVLKFLS
jgi:pimeloyl-ACP methyl ester carboxylesterase